MKKVLLLTWFLSMTILTLLSEKVNAQTTPVVVGSHRISHDYLTTNTFYFGTSKSNYDKSSTAKFIDVGAYRQFMITSDAYSDFQCTGNFDFLEDGSVYLTNVSIKGLYHFVVTDEYSDAEDFMIGLIQKSSGNACKLAVSSSDRTPILFYLIKK